MTDQGDSTISRGRNGEMMSYPGSASTDPHWMKHEHQEFENWLRLRDPNGWYEATIRRSGCIDVQKAANSPFCMPDGGALPEWARSPHGDDGDERIHICGMHGLDALIERLQALRSFVAEHVDR